MSQIALFVSPFLTLVHTQPKETLCSNTSVQRSAALIIAPPAFGYLLKL
jgi:hypothetical protein